MSGVMLPSGLIVPSRIAEDRAMASRDSFTGVSLFSGIGGMDLGFVQAGCEVLIAVEYDCACVTTYMVNLCRYGAVQMHFVEEADRARMEKFLADQFRRHGLAIKNGALVEDGGIHLGELPLAGSGWIAHQPPDVPGTPHVVVGDVRKVSGDYLLSIVGRERGEVGCVFGGPPCQGYSRAGKRDVMDPRNSLVFEWARLVTEIQPRTCIMENVPGIVDMVTDTGAPVLDELALILERGGMGSRDTFRRCMEAQTGISLMRGQKHPPKRTEPKTSDDLFAREAVA